MPVSELQSQLFPASMHPKLKTGLSQGELEPMPFPPQVKVEPPQFDPLSFISASGTPDLESGKSSTAPMSAVMSVDEKLLNKEKACESLIMGLEARLEEARRTLRLIQTERTERLKQAFKAPGGNPTIRKEGL